MIHCPLSLSPTCTGTRTHTQKVFQTTQPGLLLSLDLWEDIKRKTLIPGFLLPQILSFSCVPVLDQMKSFWKASEFTFWEFAELLRRYPLSQAIGFLGIQHLCFFRGKPEGVNVSLVGHPGTQNPISLGPSHILLLRTKLLTLEETITCEVLDKHT